jgi:hypothetical protein
VTNATVPPEGGPAPGMHLPLRHLVLCLDCDECFGAGHERCPACGSGTGVSLSRFLEQASQPEKLRQLIIVARNREHLYEHLKRAFAGNETVRVLLDRRLVERPERAGSDGAERGQDDRRSASTIAGLLRTIGWVIVPLGVRENHRGSAR